MHYCIDNVALILLILYVDYIEVDWNDGERTPGCVTGP